MTVINAGKPLLRQLQAIRISPHPIAVPLAETFDDVSNAIQASNSNISDLQAQVTALLARIAKLGG